MPLPQRQPRRLNALTFLSPHGISSSVVCASTAAVALEASRRASASSSERNKNSMTTSSSGRTETHQLLAILSALSAVDHSLEIHMLRRAIPQLQHDASLLLEALKETEVLRGEDGPVRPQVLPPDTDAC